jgi:hypothetical protein
MRFVKWLAAMAFAMALPCAALAQTSPNLTKGQVLTAGQWNALFVSKQDTLGFVPVNSAGGIMTGRLVTTAPGAATSGFNLTCGSAPASPVNGDQWCTTAGLFVQIGGTTIGPLSGATSSSFGNTSPVTLSFPSGVVTYACPTCGVTGSPLSQFSATTSAQLLGIISDETGSGFAVFNNAPTLVAPVLGAATATSINKVAITTPATSATLTILNGKTLTANNSLAFAGTDGTTMTFPGTSDTVVTLGATQTLAAKTLTAPTINGGTATALTSLGIRSTGSGAFDLTIANTENLTAGRTLTVTLNDAARTLNLGGNLTTAGAASLPAIAQGDLWFGSAAGTITALAKSTSAIRYLSNTGTSNNPAWAQVDLSTGVTNTLALANITSGTQDTALGYWTGTTVSALAVPNCTSALIYSTSTHLLACNTLAGSGNVSNTGTPTALQIAQFTSATVVQGVNFSSLHTAGAGITLTGTNNVTIAQSLTNATVQASPTVGGGSGTTPAMQGFGSVCKLTPAYSSRVKVSFIADIANNTGTTNTSAYNFRYGLVSGGTPAFNAASTGSAVTNTMTVTHPVASANQHISLDGIITGLTPGTAYWFDMILNSSANTSTLSNPNCNVMEF